MSQPYQKAKYSPISPSLFQLNRKRFARAMKSDSIAIFHSNDMMPRGGDQFYPFHQNSDFFYLTGIDQEESVLVIFPDCIKDDCKEVLFVKKTSELIAIWDGHKYTKEEAAATSGIDKVIWLEDMDHLFNELILLAKRIYVNSNENDRFVSDVPTRDVRMTAKLAAQYPGHKLHRSQSILKNLRVIKSQVEIDLLQTCCDLTQKGFERILSFIKPGVTEYAIEAELIHEFISNKATGFGYNPIIASGKNACVLHYNENNDTCKDGDVILMDFGAEYGHYTADLTRSVPINGKFTERQKAVYNSVLSVLKSATKLLVPGVLIEDYHKQVGDLMEKELLDLELITKKDIEQQDPKWPAYKKYFMHGTSHHLGLDVHDLANRYDPVQAGMVFTVEPGIYIPDENLGIRLENDILVTDNEPIDLMANIPIEAEEIEALMNQ